MIARRPSDIDRLFQTGGRLRVDVAVAVVRTDCQQADAELTGQPSLAEGRKAPSSDRIQPLVIAQRASEVALICANREDDVARVRNIERATRRGPEQLRQLRERLRPFVP